MKICFVYGTLPWALATAPHPPRLLLLLLLPRTTPEYLYCNTKQLWRPSHGAPSRETPWRLAGELPIEPYAYGTQFPGPIWNAWTRAPKCALFSGQTTSKNWSRRTGFPTTNCVCGNIPPWQRSYFIILPLLFLFEKYFRKREN